MRQLVMLVTLAATAVGAIAVIGMILIALEQGDGLAAGVIGDLQTLALIVVTAVAGMVQHYMGAGSGDPTSTPAPAAGASVTPAPAQPPSTPAGP